MKKLLCLISIFLLTFMVSCQNVGNNQSEDALFQNDAIFVKTTDGLIGVVNSTGKFVVEPIYTHLFTPGFDEFGYAMVYENENAFIINKSGKIIYEEDADASFVGYKSGHVLTLAFFEGVNRLYEVIDLDGNILFSTDDFDYLRLFNENYLIYRNDDAYGLIDFEGNYIISASFDSIGLINLDHDSGEVIFARDNEHYYLYDLDGNSLFSNKSFIDFYFSDNSDRYISLQDEDELWYLFDLQELSLSSFYSYYPILVDGDDNFAFLVVDHNNKMEFVTPQGEAVLETETNHTYLNNRQRYSFNEYGYLVLYQGNFVTVYDKDLKQVAKYDETEEVLIDLNSEYVVTRNMTDYTYTLSSWGGKEIVKDSELSILLDENTSAYFIENTENSEALDMFSMNSNYLKTLSRDTFYNSEFNGVYRMTDEEDPTKIYYADASMERINEELYDNPLSNSESLPYSDGYIIVWQNGLCGVIDFDGNIIVPIEYQYIGKGPVN